MSRPQDHDYYEQQGLHAGGLHPPGNASPYHDHSPVRSEYGYGYSNAPPQHGDARNPFADPNAQHDYGMGRGGMPSSGFDRPPHAENPFVETPGRGSPARGGGWSSQNSQRGDEMPMDHYPAQPVYSDSPYKRYSSPWDPRVNEGFDPNEIEDDGDDGLGGPPHQQQRHMLTKGRNSPGTRGAPIGAAGAGAAAGAFAGGATSPQRFEKKSFLANEEAKRKRKRWIFIVLGVIALLCIAGGAVVGGILGSRKSKGGSPSSSVGSDAGGLYDKNSAQVQELLNNGDLHRVFPGMDYTPFGAQYPDCLTNEPSQNNVTMDMAVLSQLTKKVRLYGTDCNQTQMVIEAIKRLELTDVKIWMGVWLDNNQTTNDRGMNDMFDILDKYGADPFEGVIIGNEVLFREDMTSTELAKVVGDARTKMQSKGIKLPIGVADLGDNWSKNGKDFINVVDVVMSNIHPFFAGQKAEDGAGWAWEFWQNNDIALTTGTSKKNMISEVGWPSEGGNDCGVGSDGKEQKCKSSTDGAVAGIDQMNTFMEDFVCISMKNKTDYFWFEAFDEPWKVRFNKDGQAWEDKWGLMTPDRVMKPGLKIPSCGGQTP